MLKLGESKSMAREKLCMTSNVSFQKMGYLFKIMLRRKKGSVAKNLLLSEYGLKLWDLQ